MKKRTREGRVVVYQAKSGAIELRGDVQAETIWATQAQIAEVFDIDRSVVTKHIGTILKKKEVDEKSNVQKMHIAHSDRPVAFYSLDLILAVGYRANSSKAIEFRKWASKILRDHITKGYTINRKRIASHYDAFLKTVEEIQSLLPQRVTLDPNDILDLVKAFAGTWLSLEAYDRDALAASGVTKKSVSITAEQLVFALTNFKQTLVQRGEATELFGQARQADTVEGIVGNVMQSFGGKQMYPSVEEKASHLFYFMVKNHPFVDGNKRSGAFAFVWFLQKAGVLDRAKMTPSALTALTLFIAESDPRQKEKIIRLILQLLKN